MHTRSLWLAAWILGFAACGTKDTGPAERSKGGKDVAAGSGSELAAGSGGQLGAAGENLAASGGGASANSGTGGTSGSSGSGGAGAASGSAGSGAGGASGNAGASGGAAASGGGAGGAGGMPMPSEAALQSFPVGLAIGSPAQIKLAGAKAEWVAPHRTPLLRYVRDYGRAVWAALQARDYGLLGHLASQLVPLSTAYAAPADELEIKALAIGVERVLAGDALADRIDPNRLFAAAGNANCYGPSLAYANHEDAPSPGAASGTLPGGDLGLWTQYEAGTQPCVAAQLSRRIDGVKGQVVQGLMLLAAMRHAVESSSTLAMPGAGATTDLTSELEAVLHGAPALAMIDVRAATIALDGAGTTYTYRFTFGTGASGAGAKSGEIVLRHKPGSRAEEYEGVLQVAAFSLTSDAAMGCSDAKDSGTDLYQVASVSSVKYARTDDAIVFSSRTGSYCGHPASESSAAYAAEVAAFTSGGDLDASVKLTTPTRGSSKGWRGNFARFAGDYDRETVEGDFLYTWQAGPLDGHARSLALDLQYNSATGTRTLQGFFAFGADIAGNDGSLLGMICNWAGPGNDHTPQRQFQSQVASMSAGASEFTLSASKLGYAPTNSCSSTTTEFDADLNQTIGSGEGVGTASMLDVPGASNTVEQELESRGFTLPVLY